MLKLFTKINKSQQGCKIDIVLIKPDKQTLDRLKGPSNRDLVFKGNEVHHKKHGYIGTIPDNKYSKFSKLQDFTYYWNVFLSYNDGDGDAEKVKIVGKGFSLKIY